MNNEIDNTNKIEKTIKALKDIAIAVAGSSNLDSLLQNIVDTCVKLSDAFKRSLIFNYDKNTNELIMRAENGNIANLKYVAKYSIEKHNNFTGLTLYIFTTNEILTLNSFEEIKNTLFI
ncbi:hypothetical protein QUF50_01735 [Thiotrichales bacterium HSG1]|nr:hypothetical protein [Thiotrichales bacterium HSG1]